MKKTQKIPWKDLWALITILAPFASPFIIFTRLQLRKSQSYFRKF